ncbi:hypothetical protein KC332_g1145 [Hortaea werneckii]|uniref:Uncharacterized protein n=2 Tax=Hortaea werneckii TaxID=91943 RepID=A0A3M7ITL8_HORWE|nr:hypothetical protein KC350_g11310 [Hortaea werneckii]OTA29764.1 hypothetical protein BTJ68_08838 [Hortaea werneckii EXF-2000]KAI6821469.1 hypothetical protein KC358_g9126 [Hortaea werneckii]KAI6920350.1 hypothetical protein KC348_g10426 [Hortaea werneckii]KAI6944456.1 hypothetical protein KC341_g802 [Hortaea werneckii]
MPVQWTTEVDHRLLLLILEIVQVDHKKIAERWAEKYGQEGGEQPTARAITERLYKLKKQAGGSGNNKVVATPSRKSTTSTPKTATKIVRTPVSSGKRNRNKSMSDEDDSEDERVMFKADGSSPLKRARYGRSFKTLKVYNELDSEAEGSSAALSAGMKSEANGHAGGIFDQELQLDGTADGSVSGRRRRRMLAMESDAMSDVSDFQPQYELN